MVTLNLKDGKQKYRCFEKHVKGELFQYDFTLSNSLVNKAILKVLSVNLCLSVLLIDLKRLPTAKFAQYFSL